MLAGVARFPVPHDRSASEDGPAERGRSGRAFVVVALGFLALWLLFLLFGGPVLRDQLGIGRDAPEFPDPQAPTEVALDAAVDGAARDVAGVVRWDAEGVCLLLDAAGEGRTRSCAVADPLQPIWGIDLPDAGGDGPVLVVATAPDVHEVVARLGDDAGEVRAAPAPDDLPAAFAVLRLPADGVVDGITALDENGRELGIAVCGRADGGAPGVLGGGCTIDRDV